MDLAFNLTSKEGFIRIGGYGIFSGDIHKDVTFAINKMGTNVDGANFIRRYYSYAYKSADAWTIAEPKFLLEGSRPSIIFRDTAFKEGEQHLAYVLLHELIHASGWRSNGKGAGFFTAKDAIYPGNKDHDLTHVPGYDAILKTCATGVN